MQSRSLTPDTVDGAFLIDYAAPPMSYEIISMTDVLNGTVPATVFEDCVVIVGGCSEGLMDSYSVPIDHRTLMYGAEINANIVQALIDNRRIAYAERSLMSVLTGLFAALFVFLTCGRKMRIMTSSVIAVAVLHTALCIFVSRFGIYITVLYPIVFYIVGYIINLLRKYAHERRMRVKELHDLLFSMAEAMTEAIDGRTPYNANHTKKVAEYAVSLAVYINTQHRKRLTELKISKRQLEQLQLAALLHDVGKLDIPIEVLDKPSRLGQGLERMLERYDKMNLRIRLDYANGIITKEAYESELREVGNALELVCGVNTKEWLSDDERTKIDELHNRSYTDGDGGINVYLSENEYLCLTIKKGTLTDEEMATMRTHVVFTDKILARIRFGESYSDVRRIAASHHELMSGTGYPKKLTAAELDLPVRILTIADVYDALTADDRPYKKAKSREQSFKILHFMAKDGEIDPEVLALAEQAWK